MTEQTAVSEHDELTTAVVTAVDRYGLITPATLAGLRPDRFSKLGTSQSALRQHARDGLLREGVLYQDQPYYFRDGNVFSETAKIRAYAMLAICAARSSNRTRLTRAEFRQYFPDLCRPGLPMNYYVDLTAKNPVLGFLRADLGGHSRWDRVVAKALDDARKHALEPAFERFVQRQAFEIRVVTALPQKADRIRRALVDHPNPSGLPIQVSIVPELINLIAPVPRTNAE